MKDFSIGIVQDRLGQSFYPGSSVTGSLLVAVNEPKYYKHITVQFIGRAYVHWTKAEVCYSSKEVYVDVRQILWTADQSPDGHLPPGQHVFWFRFDIPYNAPSSFEGTVGTIRYELHGQIGTGALKFDHQTSVRVPVEQMVGISDPCLLQPVRQEVHKTRGLLRASAPIVLTATVPKTGYCVGETLPVQVYIENGSSSFITLTAALCQTVVYTAEGRQQKSKKALLRIGSDQVLPHVTRHWDPALQIPPTEVGDERSCSIIRISYCLTITAVIPWGSNLSTEIPLWLGNIREQPPLEEGMIKQQPCMLPPYSCTKQSSSIPTAKP